MHVNPASADAIASASAFDTIKSRTSELVYWLGKGANFAKDTIVALVSKIILFVEPVFQGITQLVKNYLSNIKEYIDANSAVVVPVGVASVFSLFLGVAGHILLCGRKSDK